MPELFKLKPATFLLQLGKLNHEKQQVFLIVTISTRYIKRSDDIIKMISVASGYPFHKSDEKFSSIRIPYPFQDVFQFIKLDGSV